MNVLIVDDEVPAIEGTLEAVDWEKFGFSQVFTAYSMKDAQNIMEEHSVAIVICDIEMPKGSGIDLLQWVHTRYPDIQTIFLTAHADFVYAKQAVQIGCLDYLLKPVLPEELELALDKAIHQINQHNESMKYRQYGHFWLQNKPLVIERFWLDLLNRTIPSSPKAIREVTETRSLPYQAKTMVLPVLIRIQRWYKSFDLRDEKLMEFAVRNAANESLEGIHPDCIVFPVDRGTLLAILDLTNEHADIAVLKTILESYIASCNIYFSCDLSVYIGQPAAVCELTDMMDRMHTMDKNNVAVTNKVFLLENRQSVNVRVNLPDFTIWSKMMTDNAKQSLLQEVERYRQRLLGEKAIDAHFLSQFHQDFLQMVHYVLQLKGIQAHQLFNDSQSLELSVQAMRTIKDLFHWVHYVLDKAFSYMKDVLESDSIMDKVNRYVAQHIEDELTREEIANHVFLNPDYLTRIVKKETGLPISEYVQRHRMEIAKELLVRTELPISHIALQVGYKHFSQFSKMFRKHTEMNPMDYRRHHAGH